MFKAQFHYWSRRVSERYQNQLSQRYGVPHRACSSGGVGFIATGNVRIRLDWHSFVVLWSPCICRWHLILSRTNALWVRFDSIAAGNENRGSTLSISSTLRTRCEKLCAINGRSLDRGCSLYGIAERHLVATDLRAFHN